MVDHVTLCHPSPARPLILASQSVGRREILARSGLAFECYISGVDEDLIKESLAAEKAKPELVALTLAEVKAQKVAQRHFNKLVLGGDQVLAFEDRIFDKPRDLDEARQHLQTLRGKKHSLISAMAIALTTEQGIQIIWRHTEYADLWMRDFSDDFLDDYIASNGDSLLSSVGAYRIEGPGIQLFTTIRGDNTTIMGLPMIPLLGFLREHGIVKA